MRFGQIIIPLSLLAAAIALLWTGGANRDGDSRSLGGRIGTLERRHAQLQRETVLARRATLADHDELSEEVRQILAAGDGLRGVRWSNDAKRQERIASHVAGYLRSRDALFYDVERFKTDMSIYRNSLRYSTQFAVEVAGRLSPDERELADLVRRLSRQVASFDYYVSTEKNEEIRADLTALAAMPKPKSPAAAGELKQFELHVGKALQYRPLVDSAADRVIRSATVDQLAAVARELDAQFAESLHVEQRLFRGWIALAGALAAYGIALALQLARSASRLEGANERLKTIDSERGDALADGHERLCEQGVQLDQIQSAVAEQTKAKQRFLAALSHEFRLRVTSIRGFADMLASGRIDMGELPRTIRSIRENGDHLLAVVDDVVEFSCNETIEPIIDRRPFSPARLCAEIAESQTERIKQNEIIFAVDVDPQVPSVLIGDPTRISYVASRLVAHSIRFTQSGTVKIAARFDEAARRLSISIEDDGGGLTDDEFANLFEPMALGAATQRFGCTGMELPIARQIVERTGGKLSAENSPGKGCRFTIAVEVEMADDDDVARFEQELAPLSRDDDEPAPIVQTKIAGEILLVEDCPDNRRLVTQVLANAGAEMAVAENGRDGFDLAMGAWISGKPYGVLLFDMKLPGESGYEVVRRLRDAGYDQPIIALTAHAMEGDAEKCLEAGCDAYVAKPFDVRDLIATIASVIAPSIDKPPAKQLA